MKRKPRNRSIILAALVAAALASPVSSFAQSSSPIPDGTPRTGPAAAKPIPPDVARAIAIAEDERRLEPELKTMASDPNPTVRARAVLAIGRIQDSTSVPMLLPLLNDASVEVRREAVFALGQIGHKSARAACASR